MGSFKVEAHVGSWESGIKQILIFPDYENTTEIGDLSSTTMAKAQSTYGDAFDPEWTTFTFTNKGYIPKETLTSWGLKSVIEISEATYYYLSENKYIYVNNGAYIEYASNGTIIWNGSVRAMTLMNRHSDTSTSGLGLITYHATSYSWLLDVWPYLGQLTTEQVKSFFDDLEPYEETDDPYASGGISGTGGGTGTFSGTGDSISFPSLPTLSAVSTGFITLFNPSIAEMQNLASYMWSDVFDIGLYKTLFADPMDCILGCSIVPVAVPNGGSKTVNVGNVSTGIAMTVAASQYVEVDCGTLNVEEYWGSYLDYDPYTKAEIYLPYCGTHALQVDDLMGKSVHVKYHVDILSGACCAYVKCGGSVMYSFVGQCSSSIPISANDWTNVVNGALSIAASVGALAATGGTAAPAIAGATFATAGTIFGGGIKQNVEKSGSMGGTGGMLGVQTPYLILTRPRQALPKKQNTYTGYPSFITTKLKDLKGYTEIETIRITGVPATDAELSELESVLKSGVIF